MNITDETAPSNGATTSPSDTAPRPARAGVTRAQLEKLAALAPKRPAPAAVPVARSGNVDHAKVIDRARKYLAQVPGAVSGQNGHDETYRAAAKLVVDFALQPADAYPLLAEWNGTCNPPWSEHELRRKLEEVDAKETGPRGLKLVDDRPMSGTTTDDVRLPRGARSAVDGDEPTNPHRLAAEMLREGARDCGPLWLRFWRDEFYVWNGSAYKKLTDEGMRADVNRFVRRQFVRLYELRRDLYKKQHKEGDKPPTTEPITIALVNNVVAALKGACLVPSEIDAPAWLDGSTDAPDARYLLAAPNGLLDLKAATDPGGAPKLLPCDPDLFALTSVAYSVACQCPPPQQWHAFLAQLWPGDSDSIDLLQEWFGYSLTADTSQQKMLWLLGPPRSGKGTITGVLTQLVGAANVASPGLHDLAANFGLSSLVGKSLAVIGDGRLSKRDDSVRIVARLLQIVGEDRVDVDRKNRTILSNTKLGVRFVLAANELPSLPDQSEALLRRALVLHLTNSFAANPDNDLLKKLLAELPAILLWALEGLVRLRANERFTEPESAADIRAEFAELLSPVGSFLRERCVIEAGATAGVDEVYQAWRVWCEGRGRSEPGTAAIFGRNLRTCCPSLKRTRQRGQQSFREYLYTGLRLLQFGSTGDSI